MDEALLAVQWVNAALVAGVNLSSFLQRLSSLIQQRRAEGGTLTDADLGLLFEAGDKLEAEMRTKAQAALAAIRASA